MLPIGELPLEGWGSTHSRLGAPLFVEEVEAKSPPQEQNPKIKLCKQNIPLLNTDSCTDQQSARHD